MKKVVLIVLAGFAVIVLLRRLLSKQLKEAYAPISNSGKNPLEMVDEMLADPQVLEFMNFVMGHLGKFPEVKEIDGKFVVRCGGDEFDATDLKDNEVVRHLLAGIMEHSE